ncbi:MAG: hypothetical protein M3P49_06875 [Actinomycetota bacterium]|nr:hypothetical protein [Actinomycetota bacterium]
MAETMAAVRERVQAKLVQSGACGGVEIRRAYRKTEAWGERQLGRAGFWVGAPTMPIASFGRDREAAEAALAEANALLAAAEYLARRDRLTHPEGEFDSGGRFYLYAREKQGCCAEIREPSLAHPYSYMVHARTLGHVASLYAAEAKAVRRAAKALDVLLPEGWFAAYRDLSGAGRLLLLRSCVLDGTVVAEDLVGIANAKRRASDVVAERQAAQDGAMSRRLRASGSEAAPELAMPDTTPVLLDIG